MRVLAIRQPWASLIINGDGIRHKTIEVRSRTTNIRERVAIYASCTPPKVEDMEHLNSIHVNTRDLLIKGLPAGQILGTVEMCGSIQYANKNAFKEDSSAHLNNPESFKLGKTYGWKLRDPIPCIPINYKPPKGAIVWSHIFEGKIIPECSYNYHDPTHPEWCKFESMVDEFVVPNKELTRDAIVLREKLIVGVKRMAEKVQTFEEARRGEFTRM